MAWGDTNWKGGQHSRRLKRILHKYKANANKLGIKRGYGDDVVLIVGDTTPNGQAIAVATEGTVAVRYSTSASMPGVPAAVYVNTDGSTAWARIT